VVPRRGGRTTQIAKGEHNYHRQTVL